MQINWIQRYLHERLGNGAFFLQYYTILLGIILGTVLVTGVTWLFGNVPIMNGPEAMADSLKATLQKVPDLTRDELAAIEKEMYVDAQLTQIVIWAPLAAGAAFFVVAIHVLHLVGDHDVNGLAWFPSKRQDWVLQVILLPGMYAILALRSVMRSLEVMCGAGLDEFHGQVSDHLGGVVPTRTTWQAFVNHSNEMYLANFSVANFAEMYTLWCFSRLLLDLLKRSFKSKENFFTFSCVTMQGVDGFVLCGLAKVCCQILEGSRGDVDSYVDEQSKDSILSVHGMTFDLTRASEFLSVLLVLASIQCLYNVTMICWMSSLQHINPSLKFGGTRALVMFAQWQFAALEFSATHLESFPYKRHQVLLLHASLMCYECLLVSFLHVVSWPAEDFDRGYLPLENDDFDWRDPTIMIRPNLETSPRTVKRDTVESRASASSQISHSRQAPFRNQWAATSRKVWQTFDGARRCRNPAEENLLRDAR